MCVYVCARVCVCVYVSVQENWCKKGAPTPDLISSYKPQPLPPAVPRSPPPRTDAAVLQPLVRVADQLGHMLQNQHQVCGTWALAHTHTHTHFTRRNRPQGACDGRDHIKAYVRVCVCVCVQGFMANVRQQRAAGFAALELAQAVRALVTARRAGSPVWVQSQGSSVHR